MRQNPSQNGLKGGDHRLGVLAIGRPQPGRQLLLADHPLQLVQREGEYLLNVRLLRKFEQAAGAAVAVLCHAPLAAPRAGHVQVQLLGDHRPTDAGLVGRLRVEEDGGEAALEEKGVLLPGPVLTEEAAAGPGGALLVGGGGLEKK